MSQESSPDSPLKFSIRSGFFAQSIAYHVDLYKTQVLKQLWEKILEVKRKKIGVDIGQD